MFTARFKFAVSPSLFSGHSNIERRKKNAIFCSDTSPLEQLEVCLRHLLTRIMPCAHFQGSRKALIGSSEWIELKQVLGWEAVISVLILGTIINLLLIKLPLMR